MSSSRKRQIRLGRGADKGKRNPRTYYAITKDSRDIYRYASHDDRQTAIETEGLEPVTAQEFLQFKTEATARIHEIPRQMRMTQESSPNVELPVAQPPSYTESPQQIVHKEEAGTDSKLPAAPIDGTVISERIAETAQKTMAKTGTAHSAEATVTMSIQQFKELIIAAIVEALAIVQAQNGGKNAIPASTGTIVGEQPTGNRDQSH